MISSSRFKAINRPLPQAVLTPFKGVRPDLVLEIEGVEREDGELKDDGR